MKQKPTEQSRLYPRHLTSRCHPLSGQRVLWIWAVAGHPHLISTGVWHQRRPADLSGGFLGGRPTHWAPWPTDFPAIPVIPQRPRFSVGDEVKWVSQSGGYWKPKTGIVIGQVESGEQPIIPPGLRARGKFGMTRREVSWLVSCKKVVYWPRTTWVQPTGRKFSDWLAEVVK